jgi:ABC-type multidrug transport system fused ATPase/permease subunit
MTFHKNQPLLRCLALYRFMPWRFSLTALLFTVVNLSLAWQQWLIGRAVHDVERGVAVITLLDGTLDYSVARYWLRVLLAISFGRGVLQYLADILSFIIGQDLLFILRERIFVQVQRLDDEVLRRLCEGRTAIIIAHRLTTIRDADRIAVICEGKLVELGNHATLIGQGGLSASLYRAYEEHSIELADSGAPDTMSGGEPLPAALELSTAR